MPGGRPEQCGGGAGRSRDGERVLKDRFLEAGARDSGYSLLSLLARDAHHRLGFDQSGHPQLARKKAEGVCGPLPYELATGRVARMGRLVDFLNPIAADGRPYHGAPASWAAHASRVRSWTCSSCLLASAEFNTGNSFAVQASKSRTTSASSRASASADSTWVCEGRPS